MIRGWLRNPMTRSNDTQASAIERLPAAFQDMLAREWECATRAGTRFAVLIFDGPLGERAAQTTRERLRSTDELLLAEDGAAAAVFLRGTGSAKAIAVAHMLCDAIALYQPAPPCLVHPHPPPAWESGAASTSHRAGMARVRPLEAGHPADRQK